MKKWKMNLKICRSNLWKFNKKTIKNYNSKLKTYSNSKNNNFRNYKKVFSRFTKKMKKIQNMIIIFKKQFSNISKIKIKIYNITINQKINKLMILFKNQKEKKILKNNKYN
jgi:hypothetical protein